MNQKQAELLAKAVGGDAWQSGGGVWVVTLNREDGHLVVFSGEAVCEYENDEAFDAGRPLRTILLTTDERSWVICDDEGNVIYRDPELSLGWRTEEEAEHEARGIASRTGERFVVREE
jgi:hypothetical protein